MPNQVSVPPVTYRILEIRIPTRDLLSHCAHCSQPFLPPDLLSNPTAPACSCRRAFPLYPVTQAFLAACCCWTWLSWVTLNQHGLERGKIPRRRCGPPLLPLRSHRVRESIMKNDPTGNHTSCALWHLQSRQTFFGTEPLHHLSAAATSRVPRSGRPAHWLHREGTNHYSAETHPPAATHAPVPGVQFTSIISKIELPQHLQNNAINSPRS